ncbi:hypothetical protein ScPMuIL_006556 [Solemya velum]
MSHTSMATKPLAGKIALVTGATRGLGKGIAAQLGEAGALVYITGRTLETKSGSQYGGSLTETASVIQERGGSCIPVRCDHSNDQDVEKLFDQISREQDGQLDLLVNNVYSAVGNVSDNFDKKFWEMPPTAWDDVNRVGLRNHYICSVYAARMMVPRRTGLIVNISSFGGLRYLFNVPYGVGKASCDRMAVDCAIELRKSNVAMVSLWPGAVRTEFMIHNVIDSKEAPIDTRRLFELGETPEYAGRCIAHLLTDPNIMRKSGRVLLSTDLGSEYGFVDVDGRTPQSMRSLQFIMSTSRYTKWISGWVPSCVKLPKWLVSLAGNKF